MCWSRGAPLRQSCLRFRRRRSHAPKSPLRCRWSTWLQLSDARRQPSSLWLVSLASLLQWLTVKKKKMMMKMMMMKKKGWLKKLDGEEKSEERWTLLEKERV